MRKSRVVLIAFILLIGAGWYAWNRLMVVHEPVLDVRNYARELDSVRIWRKALSLENSRLEEKSSAFIRMITTRIFPYWYGTSWNFNGTTMQPQRGSIACGYFVTTTLLHMGYPINRVKMAQCASEEMIRSITSKKNVHHLSGLTLPEFESKLIALGKGVYVVGLDNHTGFLWIGDGENYFVHSSGWFPFKVVRQKISESNVLARSKYRVVGKISGDKAFLNKWIAAE